MTFIDDINQEFLLLDTNREEINISLSDLIARAPKTIFYFYPKDNTPGCTIENKDFSCLQSEFEAKGVQLIGVSKDSIASHQKFVSDHGLEVALLCDPDLVLHKALGSYGEKNNYGKIVMGVIRSTFLVDQQGNLLGEWKNIRAKGHAQRVLGEIE